MHSLDFVTLVSQDLKVKVGRPSLGKFKNNGTTFFFFSLLSGLFLLQRGKKKPICLNPQLSSLLVHALKSCRSHSRRWVVARLAAEKSHYLKFRSSCLVERN